MVNLSDFYDEISRRADTDGTKIDVATCKRVLACMFDVLGEQMEAEGVSSVLDTVVAGIQRANDR